MSIKTIRADIANFIRATFNKAQQQNTFLHWVAEKISAQKYFFYVPPEKSSRQQSLQGRSVEDVSTPQNAPSPYADLGAARNQRSSGPMTASELPPLPLLSDSFSFKSLPQDEDFILKTSPPEQEDQNSIELDQSAKADTGPTWGRAIIDKHRQWGANKINKLQKRGGDEMENKRQIMRELIKLTASEQAEKAYTLLHFSFQERQKVDVHKEVSKDVKQFCKDMNDFAEAEKIRGKYDQKLLQAIQNTLLLAASDFQRDHAPV